MGREVGRLALVVEVVEVGQRRHGRSAGPPWCSPPPSSHSDPRTCAARQCPGQLDELLLEHDVRRPRSATAERLIGTKSKQRRRPGRTPSPRSARRRGTRAGTKRGRPHGSLAGAGGPAPSSSLSRVATTALFQTRRRIFPEATSGSRRPARPGGSASAARPGPATNPLVFCVDRVPARTTNPFGSSPASSSGFPITATSATSGGDRRPPARPAAPGPPVLDQLLEPVDDHVVAVGVATAMSPVWSHLPRRSSRPSRRVVQVAPHHLRAADPQLAALTVLDVRAGLGSTRRLGSRSAVPDRPAGSRRRAVHVGDGARLGETVALDHRAAEPVRDMPRELGAERSGARHDRVDRERSLWSTAGCFASARTIGGTT